MILEQVYRLQFAVDAGMAVLIWLVQLIIYPAFRVIIPDKFPEWHHQYMKTISYVVIPLMFIQAICHGLLAVSQPSIMQWIGIAAILCAWIVTFTLSVPCHRELQAKGFQIEVINRLIQTNWLRTLFWTGTLIFTIL